MSAVYFKCLFRISDNGVEELNPLLYRSIQSIVPGYNFLPWLDLIRGAHKPIEDNLNRTEN